MTPKTFQSFSSYAINVTILLASMAAILAWRRSDRERRLASAWLWALAISSAASYVAKKTIQNTQVTAQFWFPVSVVLAMETLAAMQGSVRRRDAFRIAAGVYVLAWGFLLLMAVEDPEAYSPIAAPLHAITIATAALLTLMRRVALARGDLLHDTGFLVSIALALFTLPAAFLTHVGRLWIPTHMDWVRLYYGARNLVSVCAMILLAWAITRVDRPLPRPFRGEPV